MPARASISYRRVLILVALAAAALLSAVSAFEFAFSNGINQAREASLRRLQIFDRTLEANIERFHYLPAAIAQSAEIRALLENPDDEDLLEGANGYLSRLNSTAVSDELFVVNTDGQSVAASNWWSHVSLVGHSYGIRPYFIEAMADGDAKYYAVGMTTQVPGYFLATRIDGPDGPLGVAVVKINIGEIEAVWWRSGELLGMFDANEVAILSTRPDWRYRALQAPSSSHLAELNADQRYFGVSIEPGGIVQSLEPWRDSELAVLSSTDEDVNGQFMVERMRIPIHGWQLLSFTPIASITRAAWSSAAYTALAVTACLAATLLFRQRQVLIRARLEDHAQLEDRVRLRTRELQHSNERLNAEIIEREQAERERRKAQDGLVQAAKLASLGQALAGVAHEVSQPIAALRTQASSAKLLAGDQAPALQDVLRSMDGVIGRLSDLTSHLKTFARREGAISIQSDAGHIVANAVEMAGHLMSSGGLCIDVDGADQPLVVVGNPIHIEQILVNLITNAADAMNHLASARILIRLGMQGDMAAIAVIDTGTGIADDVRTTLFDPFITTKEPGKGLGLGLSISYGLARDMNGSIDVTPTPGGGATFTLTLPLARTNPKGSTA
ncbi:MAG: ATP-binding protein [Devosia sp.]